MDFYRFKPNHGSQSLVTGVRCVLSCRDGAFNPVDGGRMFLQNVIHLQDYTVA
jgi:hypothetical protein